MRVTHLADLYVFSSGKFRPEVAYGSSGARVFLLCLEPGQGLPARRDAEEVVCYVVEGRLRLREGEEEVELAAGDLAGVAPGACRALTARERAVVLWIHLTNKDVVCE